MKKIIKAMSPGKLGSGCTPSAVAAGLKLSPDFIGVDAGSTDPGPYYIGSGVSFYTHANIKKDLTTLLQATQSLKIPLIVGNAITTGTDVLLEQGLEILHEVAKEQKMSLKVGIVHSEQKKEDVKKWLQKETMPPLGAHSDLTLKDVEDATNILGQMGVEPIIKALDNNPDVIFAARACDDSIFAALPIREGFDPGLSLHMGKILECGSMSCIPNDLHGSLVAHLSKDNFILEPPEEHRACTTYSVAAHTLYERDNPYWQPGPGGANDLSQCIFEKLDDRRVRVSGSKWVPADYTVRMEGVKFAGYRTICITGLRDPILIGCLDSVLEGVRGEVTARFGGQLDQFILTFRQYGRDAVMGALEPEKENLPHEIGLLFEVIAETQELANSVCTFARGAVQHAWYPNIIATAGNMAYPFSPFTVPAGGVYQFHIDHLRTVKDPCSMFPVSFEKIG
ncbi:MAG: acyclic terpene utilization AtuA family protein [bacterium]|nr:acyclic terpene utilization AtuA family protein [bacterium]